MSRVSDKDSFINKSRIIHGDKYDYSSVVYKRSNNKVEIICSIHGSFFQNPNSHLAGRGCYRCGILSSKKKKILDKNNFIIRSQDIHGYRYDYSEIIYKDRKTKVLIRCFKHGPFLQSPQKHLSGQGCPECARELPTYNSYDTKEFIKKARVIYGDKYGYSYTDYVKSCVKIKIICPKHGLFSQTPNNHLMGVGCKLCSLEKSGLNRRHTLQKFIEKANLVHGKYDYSLTDYKFSNVKIKIKCPEHGVFTQTPTSHLSGRGCPLCGESKGERAIANYLDSKKIIYERERSFEGCKLIRNLYFDFFIPSLKLCIEYDGKQHFGPVDYFGGQVAFERLKKVDDVKNRFCFEHGIRIVRIPYNKKDIKNILEKEIIT